jgi:hypothetical protein
MTQFDWGIGCGFPHQFHHRCGYGETAQWRQPRRLMTGAQTPFPRRRFRPAAQLSGKVFWRGLSTPGP